MTYYSREIKMPATRKEGVANYVQMVINRLEAGDTREALLTAVGLLDDLSGSVYDGVFDEAAGPATILLSEHDAQVSAAKTEAFRKGFEAGEKAKAKALKELLGA